MLMHEGRAIGRDRSPVCLNTDTQVLGL